MLKTFMTTLTVGALSLSAFGAQAASETYEFEKNHTTVEWRANHFGFSNPSGKFMDVKGSISLDREAPQESHVEVTIATDSIVTGIDKFNNHLKSADFFNVEKFPTATFKSNNVVLTGDKTAKVEGTLTLMGISKPVTLDVTLNKHGPNPMNEIMTAGFSAKTSIMRSNFGINYAIPGVSDEVELVIEVEAQKQ